MYSKKKKEHLIEALRKSLGNVTIACKNVGISKSNFYNWLKEDEDLKSTLDEIRNEELPDFLESCLYSKCEEGDTKAIIFALKCKGKERGWVERQEITGKDGAPFQERQISIEEAKTLLENIEKSI